MLGTNLIRVLLAGIGAICLIISVMSYSDLENQDKAMLFAMYAACWFLFADLLSS